MNEIRVLVVCDWFLKYTAPLALALQRKGAKVGLLCRSHFQEFDFNQDEYFAIISTLREADIDIFTVPGRVSSLRSNTALFRVHRELRKWKPQVAHAQDNHDPRLLMLIRGYPYLFTVHDPILHVGETPLKGMRAFFWRQWIRSAARIVVHGERLKSMMAETVNPERIVVIPHGTTPREDPLSPPAERAVLLFGRLEPYKGIQVLLEAMKIVWQQRPEVKLLVSGKGPESRYLRSDPRVEVSLGYIPEAMVESWFVRASLVVLPYTEGSQSGVGLQALARGLPVVVTDVGSLPDLALDSTFVVRPGDPSSLADGLLHHLDHGRDLRDEVLRFARDRFSWDVVAQKSLRVYESIIGNGTHDRGQP